jgi:hypothetical protein
MKKISYLECTTTRRDRRISAGTIFSIGFVVGGFCVYAVIKVASSL